jgi:hypothetical protein
MSYVYKSTTGGTVNVGSYVVSMSGMSAGILIPELEALIGVSLERVLPEDAVVAEEKSPEASVPAAPEQPEPAVEVPAVA